MGRFLCRHKFSAHLGKYQRAQLLDHMVKIYLVLLRNCQLSSKVAVPFCIPTSKNESSFCSTSSLAFGVVRVLDFDHSNRCAVVSHCFIYFLKFIYCLFIFGCIGSLLLHVGFLQLRRAGATFHCSVRASHCGSFSCCRAWALGAQASVVVACRLQSAGSVVVAHGLSCFAACGIFPDQSSNPCPLHWQADS